MDYVEESYYICLLTCISPMQKRALNMITVIAESRLPDERFSRYASCALNLMKVLLCIRINASTSTQINSQTQSSMMIRQN